MINSIIIDMFEILYLYSCLPLLIYPWWTIREMFSHISCCEHDFFLYTLVRHSFGLRRRLFAPLLHALLLICFFFGTFLLARALWFADAHIPLMSLVYPIPSTFCNEDSGTHAALRCVHLDIFPCSVLQYCIHWIASVARMRSMTCLSLSLIFASVWRRCSRSVLVSSSIMVL